MISNVILHLINELPIVVDLLAMPEGSDRNVRCTNVRTVDGKLPSFVNDRHATFVFPLATIRLIEVPGEDAAQVAQTHGQARGQSPQEAPLPVLTYDEEPDENLLARIRSA